MTAPLLELDALQTHLGESHIIQGVSFGVRESSLVALLGRNGAGKTTILRSIMRLAAPSGGAVRLAGRDLAGLATWQVARRGIAFVQETRAIFPSLSVEENLAIAARPGDWTLPRIFNTFPNLAERRRNGGTELSGGEQQMLAIARALVTNPRVLLLDEPSEGLAPLIVRQIADVIHRLKATGMTILLVEQNHAMATELADAVVVLGKGRVRWSGTSAELHDAEDIRQTWLGV